MGSDPAVTASHPPAARRRSVVRLAAVVALLLFAGLWRLPTSPEEWRFLWCDGDSLFQLHRVQQAVAHYPFIPSIDPYSHYPSGSRVHWLAPHTAFYATISRVAGIRADDLDALGEFLSWIPPLLGIVSVAMVLGVASSFTSEIGWVLGAGSLAALSAETCRAFFFGIIDHHLFAHLAVLILVLGRLKRDLPTWVAGAGLFFATTPEATFYVAVILILLWISEVGGDPAIEPLPAWPWFLLPSLACLLSWFIHRSLETDPIPPLNLSWEYFTLLQPLLFFFLGVTCGGSLAALRPDRLGDRGGVGKSLSTWLALIGLVGLAVFLTTSGILSAGWLRLVRIDRIFVGEEGSPLNAGFWGASRWVRILCLAGVFWVVKLFSVVRRGAGTDEWFRTLVMVMAFTIGLLEMRHMYVLSSLQMVGVAVAALETTHGLRRWAMFSRSWNRMLPTAVLALVLGGIFFEEQIFHRQATHGDACSPLPVVEELSQWLSTRAQGPREGNGPPEYGVFAPWWIGHHLHVLGGRPVVVDPLNYPDAEDSLRVQVEVWGARTAEELERVLRAHRVKYLVITEPARAIVRTQPRPESLHEKLIDSTGGGETVLLPGLNQFAAFRLFMSRGAPPEFASFQARFFTSQIDRYRVMRQGSNATDEISIPRGQIYEVSGLDTQNLSQERGGAQRTAEMMGEEGLEKQAHFTPER